jgi:hypothetical protein
MRLKSLGLLHDPNGDAHSAVCAQEKYVRLQLRISQQRPGLQAASNFLLAAISIVSQRPAVVRRPRQSARVPSSWKLRNVVMGGSATVSLPAASQEYVQQSGWPTRRRETHAEELVITPITNHGFAPCSTIFIPKILKQNFHQTRSYESRIL